MRKVIKILATVISVIILLAIFLPVGITLLLSVNSVQNYVVDKASDYLGDYLETTVTIDRIDLDLFSKIRVRGLYVEDYEQDTLLYIGDAKARIASLNIPKDGLMLAAAELDNSRLCIREMASGELNIRPIIQKLVNPEKEGNFRLFVDRMDVSGLEFSYERLEHRNPVYGIDYNDMRFRNIEGAIENLSIVKGVVCCDLRGVSTEEKSGFKIDAVDANLLVDKGQIHFKEFKASTESSLLCVSQLDIVGRNWDTYKYFIDSVQMNCAVQSSRISTVDVAYFAPALRDMKVEVRDVELDFEGYVRDMRGELRNAALGSGSVVAAKMHFVGLPDFKNAFYDVRVNKLNSYSADIRRIIKSVVNKPLPSKVMSIIGNVGSVSLKGGFKGRYDDFKADVNLATGAGRLWGAVDICGVSDGVYKVEGDISTKGLDVGRLLDIKRLHAVDSHVVASGEVHRDGYVDADVRAAIDKLGFGGYDFSDIEFMGRAEGRNYVAMLDSRDANFDMTLHAAIMLDAEVPTYDAALDLRRADLNALGINKRDDVSVLSLTMGLNAEGATLDDIDGSISIANIEYEYPENSLSTDLITFDIYGDDGLKSAELNSEFATLQFQSRLSYREMYDYVYNSLKRYVPLLYSGKDDEKVEKDNYNDHTMLKLQAGERINDLLDAVAPSLLVAPDTELNVMFSPANNIVSIQGSSEALEYKGVIMANADLDINNKLNDSLTLWLHSSAIYLGSRPIMPNFSITGGARQNRVALKAGFHSENNDATGMLGLNALFSRDKDTDRRRVHIDITPSHFTTDTMQWKLFSRGVDIESSRIKINDLRLYSKGQQLIVDGVASRSVEDTLRVKLDNFSLAPLTALVGRWGYEVDGRSNGSATFKSVLKNPEIEADIDLDDIVVNGLQAPPHRLVSSWDFAGNQARVYISDRRTQDTIISGFYQPARNRYLAKADIKRLKLELLQPFLRGIVSDIGGTGDVDIYIQGEGRMASLNGTATVRDIDVLVDFTQTRYTSPGGTLRVSNNHIYADGVPLYDLEGHEGHYYMDLDLSHLSNVAYDISVEGKDMLVLNTTAKDNDLFYGHIYATGKASFVGDKRGMRMDIEATSADNSQFFMPLMGKENVAYADFVKFKEFTTQAEEEPTFLVRRMMVHDRRRRQVSNLGSVMDINMDFNVQQNVDMQLVIDPTLGDIIKGKGSGQLFIHYVPKANILEMRGDYLISEGSYLFTLQNIWHKYFDVIPGSSIHWNGDPMAAMLNIDAVYHTKASLRPLLGNSVQGIDTSRAVPVECYIKLTDDMMTPTVTFDVQVPNVAPEIQTVVNSTLNDQQAIATQMFWLLAANTFSVEDTGALGSSFTAATGFEMLSNQLSNWLSGDNYNIIFRYRPRSEMSGDEVDFGFSRSLLNDRLIIEVEGGYLSDESLQATQKSSNFVGEAFVTWLIDKDGAFRFRGFTQTIDRYGENQGMQESGIGVYYGESFNTFKELGESLKRRFVNEERRDKRRKRREERRARRMQQKSEESTPKSGDIIDTPIIFKEEEIELTDADTLS